MKKRLPRMQHVDWLRNGLGLPAAFQRDGNWLLAADPGFSEWLFVVCCSAAEQSGSLSHKAFCRRFQTARAFKVCMRNQPNCLSFQPTDE